MTRTLTPGAVASADSPLSPWLRCRFQRWHMPRGTRHDSGEKLPDSGRCSLRVVRCHCFTDLQSHYLSDPEAGGCTAFTPGQEIGISAADIAAVDSSGTLHGVKICPLAWQVLRPHIISTLRASTGDSSASTMDLCTDGSILLCCPSGTRPVTFAIASV